VRSAHMRIWAKLMHYEHYPARGQHQKRGLCVDYVLNPS
jgi:hypothetical protein